MQLSRRGTVLNDMEIGFMDWNMRSKKQKNKFVYVYQIWLI